VPPNDYDRAILDEMQAIRKNLTRIAEALEESDRLEANHPSRI